jgi:hypothetical protein
MCPFCISSYVTTATVVVGSTGGLAAVVHKIRTRFKGESRWLNMKLFLTRNGLRREKST